MSSMVVVKTGKRKDEFVEWIEDKRVSMHRESDRGANAIQSHLTKSFVLLMGAIARTDYCNTCEIFHR